MSDIRYEIASEYDEVKNQIEHFRRMVGKVASDTLFQFRNHTLLNECYDVMDYIDNDDITETLISKMKDIEERINLQLEDENYKKLREFLKR